MAQHAVISEYFSGQGNVLASEIVNNVAVGYRLLGNVSALAISNSVTSFDHRESITGQRAIDLRLTQALDINLAMTVESFTNENIALALFGDVDTVASAVGATITTPPVLLGFVYPLDKLNVSNVVVTDNATGLITYVEGDNYALDAASGSIRVFTAAEQAAAGAANLIAASDVLDVEFDHEAQFLINAQTQPRPEIALRFEGLNTAKGNEPVVVDIFKFNTDPLAQFNLLNQEVWQGELNGIALQDASKTTGSQFYSVRRL
jgi:hypothetical protein